MTTYSTNHKQMFNLNLHIGLKKDSVFYYLVKHHENQMMNS